MKINRGTEIKISFGILISIICLYLALKGIDFTELIKIFKTVRIPYVLLFLLILMTTLLIRSFMYYRFLKPLNRVSFFSIFEGLIIGYMANNLFPLRAGDIAKAYIIGKVNNVSKTYTFTLVLIERLFDMITLFFAFLLLLCTIDLDLWYQSAVKILAVFIGTAVILIISSIKYGDRIFRLVDIVGFFLPIQIRKLIKEKFAIVQEGLRILCDWRDILYLQGIFILIWGGYIAVGYITGLAIGLKLNLSMLLMLLVTVSFGTTITTAPGGLGVHQYACILVFSYFQLSREEALTFSLIQNTLTFAIPIILGWIFLLHTNISIASAVLREPDSSKQQRT